MTPTELRTIAERAETEAAEVLLYADARPTVIELASALRAAADEIARLRELPDWIVSKLQTLGEYYEPPNDGRDQRHEIMGWMHVLCFHYVQNRRDVKEYDAARRRAKELESERDQLKAEVERLAEELKLWKPLTQEEAERALEEAEAVPMTEAEIAEIVKRATDPAERVTNSEQAQLAAKVKQLRLRIAVLEAGVTAFGAAFTRIAVNCNSAFASDSHRGPKPFVDLIHSQAKKAAGHAAELLAAGQQDTLDTAGLFCAAPIEGPPPEGK